MADPIGTRTHKTYPTGNNQIFFFKVCSCAISAEEVEAVEMVRLSINESIDSAKQSIESRFIELRKNSSQKLQNKIEHFMEVFWKCLYTITVIQPGELFSEVRKPLEEEINRLKKNSSLPIRHNGRHL